MPITSWSPQRVTTPLGRAFQPAAIATAQYARTIAPGKNTRAKTKVTFYGGSSLGTMTFGLLGTNLLLSAFLHAPGVGPPIYPIVSGSRAGVRETQGWFVIPGGPVVKKIQHPGTPPHPYLDQAASKFGSFYGIQASRKLRLGL